MSVYIIRDSNVDNKAGYGISDEEYVKHFGGSLITSISEDGIAKGRDYLTSSDSNSNSNINILSQTLYQRKVSI